MTGIQDDKLIELRKDNASGTSNALNVTNSLNDG